MPPVTSSSLSKTWLKLTGKDRWNSVGATVFSSEWLSRPAHQDGHRHVVYNYSVGGTYYSGEFFDYALESDDHLKPGDTVEIRYNPSKSGQSYYSGLRTRRSMALICFTIGAAMAILIIGLRLLTNRGPH
jgi:hypothetical protein